MNRQPAEETIRAAISLAETWQNRANQLLTAEEKDIQDQMLRLLTNPIDKVIMVRMIDQSFRSHDSRRIADQINYLLTKHGVPDFFSSGDRLLMRLFLGVGRYFPHVSVPKVIDKMREDSSRSVIPGEKDVLYAHLGKRRIEGVTMNINNLGEAVLGEEECLARLNKYLEDLRDPEIEYISIKISTIYSQIQSLAFEHTTGILKDRLSRLFRAARDHSFSRIDGRVVPKFVNLDMEEYRDLEITVSVFRQTLDQEEFKNHSAGIVLQAYLPDSYDVQRDLTAWAQKRVAEGGSPIKIRIVKGANMEMEQVEAALHGWPLAPYDNKLDVDANFKRMVDFAMVPERIQAAHLGIGSHNLFELAYAYQVARENRVTDYFSFEMLEGMADHVRRAIQELGEQVVLYAPVATKENFINAIGYLIRRLDENTAEENFMRYLPKLKTDSRAWSFLKEQFIASCKHKDRASKAPHRIQNRSNETFSETMGTFYTGEFRNEPDTDWSLAPNRKWAEAVRAKWRRSASDQPEEIPVVVAGKEVHEGRTKRECLDSSQLDSKVCVARYCMADEEDVSRAVATAKADPDGWRNRSQAERHEILAQVAMELRHARGDLIGAAVANTGKVFTEADGEVSEAIDFAEYYPFSAKYFSDLQHIQCRGRGVGLVISPWNFPIAIPCGGILASLAAGNTVIFKPASAAVLVAWYLCRCFWRAGVSRNVLQFLPCSGGDIGTKLTNHPDVDFIILTGGTDTGLEILKHRPDAFLAAETGGKNATIVTAMSDRDQAIKNVIHSAFSNCGQKCSATSLLILEKEVYEDENFKRQLVDAARSYAVGSAWDFANKMGPLINPPRGDLEKALTRLEPGESWVLQPENLKDNPYLWTPGIKWGVQPGSYTHLTEFFGPVLGVMRARDLDHAIELVNQTGFGLTSGLESLDTREQERWKAGIKAGNLYINRGTTGAIVLRQPFGGMGKSALGAGIKVGGPNYVTQFMNFEEEDYPVVGAIKQDHALLRVACDWQRKLDWGQLKEFAEDLQKTIRAVKSYLYCFGQEFSQEKDYFHLRGQDNILRYLPIGKVVVRVHEDDSLFEVLARIAAVRIAGCDLAISIPPGLNNSIRAFLVGSEGRKFLDHTPLDGQSDEELVALLPKIQRIRYAAPDRVPQRIYQAAAESGFYISRTRVMMEGRIELLQYFQEQSICDNYHRYGNLGERALI
ncbi:bifunctional proline dehydrogenase/L-glutamate gamma-semialdehyde dehydrogenase [Desulfoferrobacter suflitae]|uniref:bifunctional proline dehydrogenase/L-glutamate gamma-semialdehyde dehydrogenase n=1 Tax=Desulfoferrobacter suflitae TaxID=2865782 RepID=UPI00216446D2|nr:proline dehydrogenase family protein [Desulfoferrobacter suflitae]MCK8603969.1 proline dehydrogenase family protein [Desulfoferrobacter suflitae]